MDSAANAPHLSRTRPAAIALWLQIIAAMVIAMVVIGGITRLTESGLSITQWQPITGVIPPLTHAQWEHEFALYQATPQYRNLAGPAGMDLAGFRFIFFWEWSHRLLGRLIGLVFALPLVWFWARNAIPKGYKPRLLALLALGGLQGVFGWYMVRSGLHGDRIAVSHFWLSIHLLTALFTLGGLVWTALDLRRLARIGRTRPARWTRAATLAAPILAIQLMLGAWVAGLNAGHASDSWPLMQGRFVPQFNDSQGLFHAMTHDPFLIHFEHRWWAWAVVVALVWFARRVRPLDRAASVAIHIALGTQILLGISVILLDVPLWLAAAHQLVGALVVVAFTWGAHVLGRRPG